IRRNRAGLPFLHVPVGISHVIWSDGNPSSAVPLCGCRANVRACRDGDTLEHWRCRCGRLSEYRAAQALGFASDQEQRLHFAVVVTLATVSDHELILCNLAL